MGGKQGKWGKWGKQGKWVKKKVVSLQIGKIEEISY